MTSLLSVQTYSSQPLPPTVLSPFALRLGIKKSHYNPYIAATGLTTSSPTLYHTPYRALYQPTNAPHSIPPLTALQHTLHLNTNAYIPIATIDAYQTALQFPYYFTLFPSTQKSHMNQCTSNTEADQKNDNTSTQDTINSFGISILSSSIPHFSTRYTCHITTATETSKYSPKNDTQTLTDDGVTFFHPTNPRKVATIHRSDLFHISNGFIIKPPQCTCRDILTSQQNPSIITQNHYITSQWTKCLHCVMISTSIHDLLHLGEVILPLYINNQSIPQLAPVISSYYAPAPTYSNAIRVRLQVILNPLLDPLGSLNIQATDATILYSMLREKTSLKTMLFNVVTYVDSLCFIRGGGNNQKILAILRVLETYPSSVPVMITHNTVVQIDSVINHSVLPSLISQNDQENVEKTPITPHYTILPTVACLYPIDKITMSQQTLSIQVVFRLLWVNINKYFFASTHPNTSSAYSNLQKSTIKGILIHGQPGVGKTFAAIRAVELLSAAISLPSPNPDESSSNTLLNLPILQSQNTLLGVNTALYPVIRFVSIDSSSLGEYLPGKTERRIDEVFHHAQQRQVHATLFTPTTFNETVDITSQITHIQSKWHQGFPVLRTQSSVYMSSDRLYPLFPPKSVGNIVRDLYGLLSNHNSSSSIILPCFPILTVLLIDEIDSICVKRDLDGFGVSQSLTNHFLILLDGLHLKTATTTLFSIISDSTGAQAVVPTTPASPTPIFVIGTTNNPNNVDIAIKRSGRLDQLLSVQPPTAAQRLELLRQLCNGTKISQKVDLSHVADACVGYVAADLSALVRNAQLHALKAFVASNLTQEGEKRESLPTIGLSLRDFSHALQVTGAASLRSNAFASFRSLSSVPTPTNPAKPINATFPQQSPKIDLYKTLVGSFASSIGGLYEAKMRLLEAVVWPIKYKMQCISLGVSPPHGVLLHGPPGNGKTCLARAVSQSLNATFIPLDMATVYNSYLGESERLLRETFSKARDNAPAVIFIDELDSIVSKRNMGDGGSNASNDVQGRILSTLLNEMDGIPTTNQLFVPEKTGQCDDSVVNNTIIVFGATNRLDMLDSALLRPGRFDYIIKIDNCDEETSYEILVAHCRYNKNRFHPSIDLYQLNHRMYIALRDSGLGCNGANISNAIYQTANIAVKRYVRQLQLKESTRHEESKSIWDGEVGNDLTVATKRYAIDEYFHDDDTGDKTPYILMQDFDQYLAPLEQMVADKRQQPQQRQGSQ